MKFFKFTEKMKNLNQQSRNLRSMHNGTFLIVYHVAIESHVHLLMLVRCMVISLLEMIHMIMLFECMEIILRKGFVAYQKSLSNLQKRNIKFGK